jgi:hypothetical protein
VLNPALLKEITHYLITDRQAVAKFCGKLNAEFFEAMPSLWHCVRLVHENFQRTKTVLSVGELIAQLDLECSKNKSLQNMIEEPTDLLNDIMSHGRYDPESLVSRIIVEIERARVLEATNKIVDLLSAEQNCSVDTILDIYSRVGSDIKDLDFTFSANELDTDLDELIDSFDNINEHENLIPTGFKVMDKHKLGLSREGEIGIVVAPPNRGKTAILLAMARNMVMRGYNVLFVTGETHVTTLKRRFWAGILDTPINKLGDIDRDRDRAALNRAYIAAKRIGGSMQWYSFIDHTAFTPTDLDFVVGKYREQTARSIDVVVLDYFDLMLPEKSASNDTLRLQINKIYKSVRRMSVKYGIPIWTASQTNREGSDTVLITDKNIGEDWQKVCNADKIISFNQTMFEADNKVARFFVMKTRNTTGKNLVVQVRTQFDKMCFKEIRELSFKEHQKLMSTLEHENRRGGGSKHNKQKPIRRL